MSLLMLVVIVVLIVAVFGGAWGHSRYGYRGWSPLGVVLLVLLLLWATGHLG